MDPGLHIFVSNRLEVLVRQLAREISRPPGSTAAAVLRPETIVIQSRGMERWLALELSRHLGICAHCVFPFPNAFLQELFSRLLPDKPAESLFEREAMAFGIMQRLPEFSSRPGCEHLRRYLAEDLTQIKRYQLAVKIADTFDQYLVFRPDLIFAWEAGRDDHWQAALWRELAAGREGCHRAGLQRQLLEKIRRADAPAAGELPARVSVFGLSHLPPAYLETFAALGALIPVNLFLMNPCREFWAEIRSPREQVRITRRSAAELPPEALYLESGNRLLAAMGSMGRAFFSLIQTFEAHWHEHFQAPRGDNLLARVQDDILSLTEGGRAAQSRLQGAPDGSIEIHVCHSPMREVEVLHDNLLKLLDADQTLGPGDILVMAPDIEAYAPLVQAVFDGQTDPALRIPFSIADRSLRRESRVVDGFLALLDLTGSRFEINRVLGLLACEPIRRRFGLEEADLALIGRWAREAAVRWGRDARDRTRHGLPRIAANSWEAGLQRLLLGYALPGRGRRLFQEILPYDLVEGSAAGVLGRFVAFAETLFEVVQRLEDRRSLSAWATELGEVFEIFFALDDPLAIEAQQLRSAFAALARHESAAGCREALPLTVVRAALEGQVDSTVFGGGFIAGGVTFCAMLPMRSIPLKIICLLGMNADAFPRDSRQPGFDLMAREPRAGDRCRRDDDRYLFLEALLSARQKLIISYLGQSLQDNSPQPPSVLVAELQDYLDDVCGVASGALETRHRLQAFSEDYFRPGSGLSSYSREDFEAVRMRARAAVPAPFWNEPLPAADLNDGRLALADLCAFWSHPARFLLQRRLGVFFDPDPALPEEREPFVLNALEKYLILQELIQDRLAGGQPGDLLKALSAAGRLPHGNVGRVAFHELQAEAEVFCHRLQQAGSGRPLPPATVELALAGVHLHGQIGEIFERGQVRLRFGRIKARDLMVSWLQHLLLCHPQVAFGNRAGLLVGRDSAVQFGVPAAAEDLLQELLQLFFQGISAPLAFFPETALAYARARLVRGKSHAAAAEAAERVWHGNDFSPGESADPYLERIFGDTRPLESGFFKLAETVLGPLLAHAREVAL
ncbi:MAG: exodeoxyribonuclease V subunit gamma [Desulfobacteraceae bacterium]|jgi:exodeoxyribonuclease V gamma subunit